MSAGYTILTTAIPKMISAKLKTSQTNIKSLLFWAVPIIRRILVIMSIIVAKQIRDTIIVLAPYLDVARITTEAINFPASATYNKLVLIWGFVLG